MKELFVLCEEGSCDSVTLLEAFHTKEEAEAALKKIDNSASTHWIQPVRNGLKD